MREIVDGAIVVKAIKTNSPWRGMRTWVSPGDPTRVSGNGRMCLRRIPPRRAGGGSRPPCASPRGRAPCAGGTCAGSRTLGRAHRCPSTPSRRRRR